MDVVDMRTMRRLRLGMYARMRGVMGDWNCRYGLVYVNVY